MSKDYLITELTDRIEKLSNNAIQNKMIKDYKKNKVLSEILNGVRLLALFDNKLFDDLVLYRCIERYDENGIIYLYMIRFII